MLFACPDLIDAGVAWDISAVTHTTTLATTVAVNPASAADNYQSDDECELIQSLLRLAQLGRGARGRRPARAPKRNLLPAPRAPVLPAPHLGHDIRAGHSATPILSGPLTVLTRCLVWRP